MKHSVMLLLLAAALAAAPTQAQKLYKWVGPDGKVSYQDRPPAADAGTVQEKNLSSSRSRDASEPAGAAQVARQFPVVLYSVTNCGSCDDARAYLKQRGVPFNEMNVGNNPALQKKMIEKVGQLSVPTITVGGKVMSGYIQSLLAGELDQAGYPKSGPPASDAGEPEASPEDAPQEDNPTP